MRTANFFDLTYEFTQYTHNEIISALEDYRRKHKMHQTSMAKKIGYNSTIYCKLVHNRIKFTRHSFFNFAQRYAPQLLQTEKMNNPVIVNKELDCIEYLKSKGYKILKPVTDFVEL